MLDSQPAVTAARVQDHFPEGLTGIIAVGGTRTSFLLSQDVSSAADLGRIDPAAYAAFGRDRYFELVRSFCDLGGRNLIIPVLSYQSFHERGEEYATEFTRFAQWLAEDEFQSLYRELELDPYFCGIDTLLHLPPGAAHDLGARLADFQAGWAYKEGRRKVIWEIAPMPLYAFWSYTAAMPAADRDAFTASLASLTDLDEVYHQLFRLYCRAALGTELPVPHFYLGTNRNGDLKLRAPQSLSLLCGGAFRLFYTPYPTLFTTRATLERILIDLMDGGGIRAFAKDYQGAYTPELFAAEQARVFALRDDPSSTIGLLRRPGQ